MRKITISGSEYELRHSLRGLFVFEKITGRVYNGDNEGSVLFDVYLLFYSLLMAANEHFSLTVNDFVEACDVDPRLMVTFNEVMAERRDRDAAIIAGVDAQAKKKRMEVK